jgi:hypothetical protein
MCRSRTPGRYQSTDILEQVRRFWRERLDVGTAVLVRAIGRGELPPETDADLLIETFLAPVLSPRALYSRPVTAGFVEHLIDLLLDGAVANPRWTLRTRRTSNSAGNSPFPEQRAISPQVAVVLWCEERVLCLR